MSFSKEEVRNMVVLISKRWRENIRKKDTCNYFLIELSYFEQHRYRWEKLEWPIGRALSDCSMLLSMKWSSHSKVSQAETTWLSICLFLKENSTGNTWFSKRTLKWLKVRGRHEWHKDLEREKMVVIVFRKGATSRQTDAIFQLLRNILKSFRIYTRNLKM